jgi:hypothetical protein
METIKEFVKRRKENGTEDFHKVLVLEAVSEAQQGPIDGVKDPVKIEVKELDGIDDALFGNYDKDNRGKLRSAFRLPGLYTGETLDYTRATAKESTEVAEKQVFGPERKDFDSWVNRMLMPELDAVYYKFKTLGAQVTTDDDKMGLWSKASDSGLQLKYVIPGVAKVLGIEIDTEELENLEWAQKPKSGGGNQNPFGSTAGMFGPKAPGLPTTGQAEEALAKMAEVIQEAREAVKRGKDGKARSWLGRLLAR